MSQPNQESLFGTASSQGGHFTVQQAEDAGYSKGLRAYHLHQGNFLRPAPGVYRLRWYPSWEREEVMVAWLWAGRERAVVSHESALDLLDLGEEIPGWVHLTVPRTARSLMGLLAGVRIHTSVQDLAPAQTTWVQGMRVTSPARSIADYARAGGRPDQVEKMMDEARARGVLSAADLEGMPARVGRRLVAR